MLFFLIYYAVHIAKIPAGQTAGCVVAEDVEHIFKKGAGIARQLTKGLRPRIAFSRTDLHKYQHSHRRAGKQSEGSGGGTARSQRRLLFRLFARGIQYIAEAAAPTTLRVSRKKGKSIVSSTR